MAERRTNLEILLSDWGHWQVAQAAIGLGFPKEAPFSQMRVDGQRRSDPEVFLADDDIRRLDVAIGELHPDMRVVVTAHYVWPGLDKQRYGRLGMSRSNYYHHLQFSHLQLAFALKGKYMRGYETELVGA